MDILFSEQLDTDSLLLGFVLRFLSPLSFHLSSFCEHACACDCVCMGTLGDGSGISLGHGWMDPSLPVEVILSALNRK